MTVIDDARFRAENEWADMDPMERCALYDPEHDRNVIAELYEWLKERGDRDDSLAVDRLSFEYLYQTIQRYMNHIHREDFLDYRSKEILENMEYAGELEG